MTSEELRCWVCNSAEVELHRPGINSTAISSQDFLITDAHYGRTLDIYRCKQCEFQFCPTIDDSLPFYEEMADPGYEDTREERLLQARKLLKTIVKASSGGTLLDVGAGSGILLEEATKLGFRAQGIEPSRYLAQQASKRGLSVIEGILPHEHLDGCYDIVTLIDVIEHVPEPRKVITQVTSLMGPQSICAIATPDLSSLVARAMSRRWWHFRIAHISYFTPRTLARLLESCDLEIISCSRPGWYFTADYLLKRIQVYLPRFLRFPIPAWLSKIVIPLNLRDSLLVVCKKRHG